MFQFILIVVTPTFTSGRCKSIIFESTESLVLYTAVLKPNLDLFFGETQRRGHLDTPQSGEVHSVSEGFFQFQ